MCGPGWALLARLGVACALVRYVLLARHSKRWLHQKALPNGCLCAVSRSPAAFSASQQPPEPARAALLLLLLLPGACMAAIAAAAAAPSVGDWLLLAAGVGHMLTGMHDMFSITPRSAQLPTFSIACGSHAVHRRGVPTGPASSTCAHTGSTCGSTSKPSHLKASCGCG